MTKVAPSFLDEDLKINAAEYLKIMQEILLPWIDKNHGPMKSTFIQDSTTTGCCFLVIYK